MSLYRLVARRAPQLRALAGRHFDPALRNAPPQAPAHLHRPRRQISNPSTSIISTPLSPPPNSAGCSPGSAGLLPPTPIFLQLLELRSRRPPRFPRMLYADQKTYLVELLMKQDQMSMAASIESRVPFLDHAVRRVRRRRSRQSHETSRRRRQIHSQESRRRSAAARNRLSQEDGLSHAAAPVAAAIRAPSALFELLRAHGRPAGRLHRSSPARSTCSTATGAACEDATDRIWRLLNLQFWGDMFSYRQTREPLEKG